MITEKNLIRHEMIGLDASVFSSMNRSLTGISGKIVDETRSMMIFKTGNGLKKVPKNASVFIFSIPNGKRVKVSGKRISYRPEDRIKLKVRKW